MSGMWVQSVVCADVARCGMCAWIEHIPLLTGVPFCCCSNRWGQPPFSPVFYT